MVSVVLQQALAIAAVELEEKVLVLVLEQTQGEVDHHIAAADAVTWHHRDAARQTPVVAHELRAELAPAAVFHNILVVHAVDYGRPYFGVYHKILRHKHIACQGDPVPRARPYAVATVALVLDDKCHLAYVTVLDKERLGKAYAGIEVKVGHRHGVLKHIPEALLRIEEIQVCAPGQRGLREPLRYRDLKLDIGVDVRRLVIDRWAEDKIIILVYAEVGLIREVLLYTILKHRLPTAGNKYLSVRHQAGQKKQEQYNLYPHV